MTRKIIKYVLLVLVIGLLAYNSIYIKKLSEVKAAAPVAFDAASFVQQLWKEQLPARLNTAAGLDTVIAALRTQPDKAFEQYSNTLSIGNIRYSMIKTTGRVLALNEDEVTVLVACAGNPVVVKLNTEYIYGNAIRDASGLVNVKDFVNTMDLNNISGELNKHVRQEVLPAFKASVQKQDSIAFTGAVELNKEHLKLEELSIIPVQIKIIPR
jgi:predicted lipoprotein